MNSRQNGNVFVSILLLLRAVRWYNVLLTIISQYLVALYVFDAKADLWLFLKEYKLHLIVLSMSLALAGGFIINGFYDVDKDLINRPREVLFNRLLDPDLLLNVYAGITVLSLFLSILVSLKFFIFCGGIVFLFWFYSHKLQKLPLIREISSSLLALAPLLAIWLHYGVMHYGMLLWTGSLAVAGFTRGVVKDLMGNRGNMLFGYETLVVVTGGAFTKRWLVVANLLITTAYGIGYLIFVNGMDYFAVISGFTVFVTFLASLVSMFTVSDSRYAVADTMLKITIIIHVMSLVALPILF